MTEIRHDIVPPDEPSPCDGCINRDRCRVQEICCRDYITYVDRGMVVRKRRKPSKELYYRLFPGLAPKQPAMIPINTPTMGAIPL